MNMQSIVSPLIVGLVMSGASLIVSRGIFGRLDKIDQKIEALEKEARDNLRQFTTKEEHDKLERDNHASHSTIWGELNGFRDTTFSKWRSETERRITVVETRQAGCKTCMGKD